MTRERKRGWNRNEGRRMEMRERKSGGDRTEESRKKGKCTVKSKEKRATQEKGSGMEVKK